MATTEELIALAEENDEYSDTYCCVDITNRAIVVPTKYQILGVQNDKDSTRIAFRCNKEINDDIDISNCKVYIHYQTANGEIGQYEVDDIITEDDIVYFTWLLSEKITKIYGIVQFQLCVKNIVDGAIVKDWHTTLAHAEIIKGLGHDDEVDFIINLKTRGLISSSGKYTLVQYDHNSENFCFQVNRYIDGYDIMDTTAYIHYITGASAGIYEVRNMRLSEYDEDTVIFDWIVSSNVTNIIGNVQFVVKFNYSIDNILKYSWNTDIDKSINVVKGINNTDTIITENIDLLEQWKNDLFGIGDTEESKIISLSNSEQGKIMATSKQNKEELDAYFTSLKEGLPADYTKIEEDVSKLNSKSLTVKLNTDGILNFIYK